MFLLIGNIFKYIDHRVYRRSYFVWSPEIACNSADALLIVRNTFQNQAKIQKMIEQEAIDQNYHMAMEEAPEVFARVSMLYIDTEV